MLFTLPSRAAQNIKSTTVFFGFRDAARRRLSYPASVNMWLIYLTPVTLPTAFVSPGLDICNSSALFHLPPAMRLKLTRGDTELQTEVL